MNITIRWLTLVCHGNQADVVGARSAARPTGWRIVLSIQILPWRASIYLLSSEYSTLSFVFLLCVPRSVSLRTCGQEGWKRARSVKEIIGTAVWLLESAFTAESCRTGSLVLVWENQIRKEDRSFPTLTAVGPDAISTPGKAQWLSRSWCLLS